VWQSVVNIVMNVQVPSNAGNFVTRPNVISFSRCTLLHVVSMKFECIVYLCKIKIRLQRPRIFLCFCQKHEGDGFFIFCAKFMGV
jgi:hypothetical protein